MSHQHQSLNNKQAKSPAGTFASANLVMPENQLAVVQKAGIVPERLTVNEAMQLQRTIGNRAAAQLLAGTENEQAPKEENKTGLPNRLKSKVENLTGISLDGARVHYNSPNPVGLGALAYTQDADIYVAPGQEKHLPHEVYHVIQQLQGRVRPTGFIGGQLENNDPVLEQEADTAINSINGKAVGIKSTGPYALNKVIQKKPSKIENFEQVFIGSIKELMEQMRKYEPLVRLFYEQFPENDFSLFFGLFGITTLGMIEDALKDSNPKITVTVIKGGDDFFVKIENSYIEIYNILEMESDPPCLKLYKWSARRYIYESNEALIPKGVGCWVFEEVRKSASRLGIHYIKADAVGDPEIKENPEIGYYVWPRFGFNLELQELQKFKQKTQNLWLEQQSGLEKKIKLRESMIQKLSSLQSGVLNMDQLQKLDYSRALEIRRVMGEVFDETTIIENQYLELDLEINKIQERISKHYQSLNWYMDNKVYLNSLNDLFLLPDPETRLKIAALWRDFGEEVHGALFDLTENSRSNQIFLDYRQSAFAQSIISTQKILSKKEITDIDTLRRLYGLD